VNTYKESQVSGLKDHNFCKIPINQVKKTNKGGSFGLNQASIDTNILSTQIIACTCLVGYHPLSHKSTPIKEVTSYKRKSLYDQITLQGQHHDNKSPKIDQRLQLSSVHDHTNEALNNKKESQR